MAYKCHWCQRSSFINPINCQCLECSNALFADRQAESIVTLHMEKTCELPFHLMRMVIGYAYRNNSAAEVRRHYILCALLAEGSRFRLLTYYYNGCYGNISLRQWASLTTLSRFWLETANILLYPAC